MSEPTHQKSGPAFRNRQGVIDFFACVAVATFIFGLQFIYYYFQGVIETPYSSYLDWMTGLMIAVFFGSLMLGTLLKVFPWRLLERSSFAERLKQVLGL